MTHMRNGLSISIKAGANKLTERGYKEQKIIERIERT